MANAPDDTVTKAMWYAVDAEGVEPNYFIAEAEIEGGGELTFDLTNNDMLWPAGKSKVEIYLNEELKETLEFSVIGSVSAAPAADTVSTEEMDTELAAEEFEMACAIESGNKTRWNTGVC